ncbi:bacteriohemerythrin [Pseudoduganella sp. OTU4001]|uniref:bacteriohemerythrin n=1 Tax=Pseudoduganella sp. OTU4001 TaxID=3043854 RepID=UPI00313D608C
MDSIVFGPDLALGIPVMDQSHRIIFDLLQSIDALPRPAFEEACHQLAEEFAQDLAEENHLMEAIGYPLAATHRAAHDSLLASLDQACCLLAAGDESSARRMVRALPDWVEAHINTMDLALAIAASNLK